MKIAGFILASIVLFLSTQCMVMEHGNPIESNTPAKGCCSKKEVVLPQKKGIKKYLQPVYGMFRLRIYNSGRYDDKRCSLCKQW